MAWKSSKNKSFTVDERCLGGAELLQQAYDDHWDRIVAAQPRVQTFFHDALEPGKAARPNSLPTYASSKQAQRLSEWRARRRAVSELLAPKRWRDTLRPGLAVPHYKPRASSSQQEDRHSWDGATQRSDCSCCHTEQRASGKSLGNSAGSNHSSFLDQEWAGAGGSGEQLSCGGSDSSEAPSAETGHISESEWRQALQQQQNSYRVTKTALTQEIARWHIYDPPQLRAFLRWHLLHARPEHRRMVCKAVAELMQELL